MFLINALVPIAVLLLPVVFLLSDRFPTAKLYSPVVFAFKEFEPIAIVPVACVDIRAPLPIAIL